MLQAGCIYLGLITPCPETFHPLHLARDLSPPAQLQMPSQLMNTQNILPDVSLIASTNLPLNMEPPWSLSALSVIIRPNVAPPCLNKGNLLLLRLSFLFCLARTIPYTWCLKWYRLCLHCNQTGVQFLGQEDPLEKEMANHPNTLA